MGTTFGRVARVVGMILIALQSVVVVYLAITINWPDRGQKMSQRTGLPTWDFAPCHSTPPPPSSPSPVSKNTVLNYASALVTGVTCLACILSKWKNRYNDEKKNDSERRVYFRWTLLLFDDIIAAYVGATFIALITALFISVGKLWAILGFGIVHNLVEVFIVAALCHKGSLINYVTCSLITLAYSGVVAVTVGVDVFQVLRQVFFFFFFVIPFNCPCC